MLFSLASTVLGLVALTHAVDHAVVVGGPGGVIAYNPPSVSAAVGDTVTFTFQQKNHTITQSSLKNPCTPLAGGFDSGFQPVSANDTSGPFPAASITIQSLAPIWIYCRQQVPSSHCAAGMVFAINPGPGQLAAFQAAATATGSSTNATTTAATSSAAPSSTAAAASSTSAPAPSSTAPANHKVLVGDNGALNYNPANITAQVGDTITFEFRAKNHTISQSSFAAPCRLLGATSGTAGFDSGFTPVAANSTNFPTYTITVNDTNPIWAYCRQTNPSSHCGAGMVFSANAVESSSKNFEAFMALAQQLNGTSSNSTSSSHNSNGVSTLAGQSAVALVALALGVVTVL
ncbi:hypothetical protein JB92DRAFT_3088349 [Gautieria morchelliformis]|nr:hypothetical protein JB92DRAFT_3088349 [Gautieria morchelliformis]